MAPWVCVLVRLKKIIAIYVNRSLWQSVGTGGGNCAKTVYCEGQPTPRDREIPLPAERVSNVIRS